MYRLVMVKIMFKNFLGWVSLLATSVTYAENFPPTPSPSGAPPPPVGLPIDGYVIPGLVIALIVGVIFKVKIKSKSVTDSCIG